MIILGLLVKMFLPAVFLASHTIWCTIGWLLISLLYCLVATKSNYLGNEYEIREMKKPTYSKEAWNHRFVYSNKYQD